MPCLSNLLSTPQVAAYHSIEQSHLGSERLSAQPQELALQHVKRPIDSVHGLRLISCLARSPSRQLAMPVGMPASAREAEKGAIACAVAASLPGSRLLSRLVEPATELARYVPLFPSRIDRPSPDKSAAARAEFRERVLLPVFHRLGPNRDVLRVRPLFEGGERRHSNHPFLTP